MKPSPVTERLIAYLNTMDWDTGEDVLGSPERAAEWIRREWTFTGVVENAGVQRVRQLREGLRALVAGEVRDELKQLVAEVPVHVRLADSGDFAVAAPENLEDVLGGLLGVAVLASALPDWRRVKVCQNPTCRWAYYDRSKSATQKWCSMASCGSRLKARRHRERARGGGRAVERSDS